MNRYHTPSQRGVAFTAVLALLFSLASCKEANNRELAEQGVTQFHSQLNSEQYLAICAGAEEKFRKAANEIEFVALLQAVHRKLGKVQQSKLQSSQVGWFAGEGTVVTLFYNTQFVDGKAGEKFIWHVRDNHAILDGYYINSSVLITK